MGARALRHVCLLLCVLMPDVAIRVAANGLLELRVRAATRGALVYEVRQAFTIYLYSQMIVK